MKRYQTLIIIALLSYVITDISLKVYKSYNPVTITSKDFSVYTSEDIIHVVNNSIFFESSDTSFTFTTDEEQYEFLENLTAHSSTIHGYQYDLDYIIRNGYIFARTVYNDDEQYTDLVYNGPSWIDNTKDTTYVVSTFNIVEQIYNPITKSIEYDHYTVD